MIELSTIHVGILIITMLVVIYTDHLGLLYVLGKKAVLSKQLVTWLHRVVLVGLLGMIGTGFFLFLPMSEYLLSKPNFYVKMLFVLTLVVNAFVINAFMKHAFIMPFKQLPSNIRRNLLISGAVSTLGWLGAILGGLYLL